MPNTSSAGRVAAVALLVAAVAGGCRCGDTTTHRQFGEIGVVYPVDGQTTRTDRDATYDFGPVFMGQSAGGSIVIKNLGRGDLVLSELVKVEGDATRIGEGGDPSPVWDVKFTAGESLGGGALAEFEVQFSPPQQDATQVDHRVTLQLRTGNAREGEETATITLVGRGVSGVCELPHTLDFGSVAVEDTSTLSFDLQNPTQVAAQATVGDVHSSSGDHAAFNFTAESARGAVDLEPGSTLPVSLWFRPTQEKEYVAFVKARASAECPEQTITLTGKGVDQVLSWSPSEIDCGYASPGGEVSRELTFVNAGSTQVHLTDIAVQNATEFGAATSQLTVPAATRDAAGTWTPGTAPITVTCTPAVVGPRTTQLTFNTGLVRQAQGSVKLKVFGGGPDIHVQPSPTLNFGKVAYFANATQPSFQRRKLTVMNVGNSPAESDPNVNLRLGTPNGSGGFGIPFVQVKAVGANTSADEFMVTLPASYDPAVGLEAKAGKNLAELVVTLTPMSLGEKQAEISIFSNDPDEPAVTITVTANAVELPPCDYEVSPASLSFGLISPPDYRDLAFTIKNRGVAASDICLLSGLDIAPGSSPFFSLPEGPIASRELLPGEVVQVLVRVWPQGQTPTSVTALMGAVEFYLSSPVKPQAQVALSAQLAPSCLTIAPDELDFGTVEIGCSSATRTFSIYNTCAFNVTLTGFRMQSAAGQSAGGPNCPGTSACPEYHLVQTPPVPSSGIVLAPGANPIAFQAKYRPIDVGSDSGAVAIDVTQSGTNVTYVVALQGEGALVGIHTDEFTQDAKPKADILLVIDNSCSMADEQQSLATNFASFIKYANAAQVDYHIAVTTTDMGGSGAKGRFVSGLNHPEKVLTPTTPDVENKFKAKVNLGITGSGSEEGASPALTALTAPLVNADNAGFLRNDAALAVVIISDEQDQSPLSTSYYLNGFWNLKGFNRKTDFTFNAIAALSPSCKNVVGGGDTGEYAFYVAQTNGVKDDICTPDWAATLEDLGKTAFGFRTHFFLTSVPDLAKGPIEVRIDGIAVPEVDAFGSKAWEYDPVGNSVNFQAMFVPEPGQTLTIRYHVTCYP